MDISNRLPVLETKWVDSIVSNGRVPIPIPEAEIACVNSLVSGGLAPQRHEYVTGQHVRIIDGPLCGVTGVIVRSKDRYRIVVGISLLQRAVSAEVDGEALVALAPASSSRTSLPAAASGF
jgi:transcription antitermination factor NusG